MKSGKIQELPNLKEIDEKFETRIEKFAKRELISGLFAKGILLVEGDSELSGIPLFSQEHEKGLEHSGVEVIKGDGKDNVFKYASFYNKCGIPVISLIDNDSDISYLLDKYKKNNINSLVLKQPKDYETAIINMQRFQNVWEDLFEEIQPFKKYKDNYLKPFKSENSKSEKLKQKCELIESKCNDIKTIEDIIPLLDEDEIYEYQREFLHLNLSGIRNAKYVATYLITIGKDEEFENTIPTAFSNIFKTIGIYINNGSVCDKSKRCVVNKIIEDNFEHEEICYECAGIKEDYMNVLQIKDDSNEA